MGEITKTDLVNSDQLVGSIVKRSVVNGKNNVLTTWAKFDSGVISVDFKSPPP